MSESPDVEVYLPEESPGIEQPELEICGIVETLIQSPEQSIGKGATAEVYAGSINEGVCYKVLKETYDLYRNTPRRELELLAQAAAANFEGCRTPFPIAWIKLRLPELESNKDYLGVIEVLSMERLNAVTLDSIIKGEEMPPENFDPKRFFENLENFIDNLHHAAKIHHRDLHGSNVMVDLETGDPRVIDFGASLSTLGWSDYDTPYESVIGNKVYRFADDKSEITRLKQLVISNLRA